MQSWLNETFLMIKDKNFWSKDAAANEGMIPYKSEGRTWLSPFDGNSKVHRQLSR